MTIKLKKTEPTVILPGYGRVVDEHMIQLDKERLIAIVKIDGMNFQAESDGVIESAFESVNALLVGLAKDYGGKLAVWTHLVKRTTCLDQKYQQEGAFLQGFTDQYLHSFAQGRFYRCSYYVSFVLKYSELAHGVANMQRILTMANATLNKFGVRTLSIEDHGNGVYSCGHAEFLARLYNLTAERMPLNAELLQTALVNCDHYFGYDVMETHNSTSVDRRHAVFYLLRDYPPQTCCGMFDFLLHSQHEFVLSQSMVLTSSTKAMKAIDAQINKLSSTGDGAEHQIEELKFGRGYLASGEMAFGDYQATLMVLGTNAADAIENGSSLSSEFFSSGLGARWVRTTTDAVYAFSSMFPGSSHRPLASPRSTTNLSCGFSMHNYPAGKARGNPIGDGSAVMPLKTVNDALYHLNFHPSDLDKNVLGEKFAGHVLLLGATGTGKSTLMATTSVFLRRFDPLYFGIDFNRSMELSVRAMGGHYFAIVEGMPSGLNPFQLGEADDQELRSFLYRLVPRCAAGQHELSIEDEVQLKKAVDAVLGLSRREDRRFSALLHYLPKGSTLRHRVQKWCQINSDGSGAGELSWALDSPINRFDPASMERIAFDTTSLLDKRLGYNPATEPVIATLMFIKDRMQREGRLMQTVIEEFWMPASYPLTQEQIKSTLKAGRLKGEFAMLVSQSPEDAINCPIFAAITQQTPTKILLPNPDATWEGYQAIGLTEKEFQQLKKLAKDSRTFLVKQSQASVFCKLDLYGFDDYLPLLSGTLEGVHLCKDIREMKKTDDPAVWIPEFQAIMREKKAKGRLA